jgi:hypothetical protein
MEALTVGWLSMGKPAISHGFRDKNFVGIIVGIFYLGSN